MTVQLKDNQCKRVGSCPFADCVPLFNLATVIVTETSSKSNSDSNRNSKSNSNSNSNSEMKSYYINYNNSELCAHTQTCSVLNIIATGICVHTNVLLHECMCVYGMLRKC